MLLISTHRCTALYEDLQLKAVSNSNDCYTTQKGSTAGDPTVSPHSGSPVAGRRQKPNSAELCARYRLCLIDFRSAGVVERRRSRGPRDRGGRFSSVRPNAAAASDDDDASSLRRQRAVHVRFRGEFDSTRPSVALRATTVHGTRKAFLACRLCTASGWIDKNQGYSSADVRII